MATCIQCGREVPEQFAGAPCPACVHRAREAAQRRQFWEYVRHAFSSVTGVLIGANLFVFLAMVLRGVSLTDPTVDQIVRWGANFGPYTLDHQWWRLLTCMFLHIGIVHLLLNMWALLNVGPLAEAVYGRLNFLLMYFICGLSGSLASLLWNPAVTSAGASGAIFGIIGALIATLYFDKVRIPRHISRPILTSLVASAISVLAYGYFKTGIDNGAHIGGLVSGLILGTIIGRQLEHTEQARRFQQIVFAISAVVLVATGFLLQRVAHYVVPLEKAESALASGKPDAALPFADQAVREKPGSAEVHFIRANVLARSNQPEEAEKEFRRVLELQPKQARAWDALGRLYVRQNRWPDAAQAFTKATDLAPGDASSWYDLGLTLQRLNRPDEAIPALKHAAQLRPTAPDYWFTLGLTAMTSKNYDEAITAFQQAAKLVPNEPEPVLWLANAYAAKGMHSESEAAYTQAQQLANAKAQKRQQRSAPSQ
jgi:membrane associated rhomboid family serine protease/Flp pilus assembly protein TadD